MSRPWSKARPHPYRFQIKRGDGVWVGAMTRPNQAGEMVSRKATRLDAVTPTAYDYGSLKPYEERPVVVGPFTGGMGQVSQQPGQPTRYRYALNADCSIGGHRRKGPALTWTTHAGMVTQFVDALEGAGAPRTMALAGNTLRVRTTATLWQTLVTAPVGGDAFERARFYQPQVGGFQPWLFLTTRLGRLYVWDPLLVAPLTEVMPAAGSYLPHYVMSVGDELYVANRTTVRRLTPGADPTLDASYAAAIRIGDGGAQITDLCDLGGVLGILRGDGLYTLNDDGTFNYVSPDLRRHAASSWNLDDTGPVVPGRSPANWRGRVWVGYGSDSWALTPGDPVGFDLVGLSRLAGDEGPVKGEQTAFAGDDWFGWIAYYDAAAGDSYLVKWGAWVPAEAEAWSYVEVPNGAVAVIDSKRVTSMAVSTADSTDLDLAGSPLLLVGCADGSIGEVTLPRGGPDPLSDDRCRFTADTAEVYWADRDAGAPADVKHWRGFTATGEMPDRGGSVPATLVTLAYRTDAEAAFTTLLPAFDAPSGERVNTSGLPTPVVSTVLQVRERLGGGGQTTADLAQVVLFEQVRPALQLETTVTVVAAENQGRLDGGVDRRTGTQIRDALRQTTGPGPTEARLPDGTHLEADFVDYAERLVPAERSYGPAWDVDLTLVEFKTLS